MRTRVSGTAPPLFALQSAMPYIVARGKHIPPRSTEEAVMPTPARVVVLPREEHAPLRIEEVRLPDPGPYQVVVKQFASGVCHSQLHQMHRPRTDPVILGHESTGVVLATGARVDHVKEGDRVLVTWVARDRDRATRAPE